MLTRCWIFFATAFFLQFLAMSVIKGAGATVSIANDAPAHPMVLRVSDTFLNSVMDDQDIDYRSDVQETILGTSVYGRARTFGKPGVKLVESADGATFYITFNGAVYSRTVGYNGPAIIHSRSVTNFTAWRKVVFKPGEGFYALPSKVSAQTETTVEGISSTRGGLIGRIVCRRAQRIEASRHAEATEIAREKTQRRIEVAFDRSSAERLARLNSVADFRTLAKAAIQSRSGASPIYACCTTPHYLQVAASFGDSGGTIRLPATDRTAGAPIEFWLHDSLWDNPLTASMVLLAPHYFSHGYDSPGTFQSFFGDQLRTHRVEGWQVVQINMAAGTPASSTPAATVVAKIDRPVAGNRRIWTSGQYTADAEFLSLDGSMVKLRRSTGVETRIPFGMLSPVDRLWIQSYLASR